MTHAPTLAPGGARREMPLIPADSTANRALVVVIAIMTLLACLTAGAALQTERAAWSWRDQVSREVTILLKPTASDDADALARAVAAAATQAPGVEFAHALSLEETGRILEPWLGRGVDVLKLPLPRLVVVRMQAERTPDLAALTRVVHAVAPQAGIDDHTLWLSRLATIAGIVVFLAGAIFVLMLVAMATAIGFATRGAVAANRDIIEVLHFVGASDHFVALQFQSHFLALGLRGAAIGGGAALACFVVTSLLFAWGSPSPQGVGVSVLLGGFSVGLFDVFLLVVISVGVAALTGYISRWIVHRYLFELL